MSLKICKHCLKPLSGRRDKLYCDVHCKSAYQYHEMKTDGGNFYRRVDIQLKKNRAILKQYNKAGLAKVDAKALYKEDFNPNLFTHFWKNQKGDVYLFVYEYGFLKVRQHGKEKYVLIKWQEYMNSDKPVFTT